MNKLVLSALAATVATGSANANEGEWAGLDAELSALTSVTDDHGITIGGWFEAGVNMDSGGVVDDPLTAEDETVEAFDDWQTGRNRVNISGDAGGTGWMIGFDVAGDFALQDAYMTHSMGDFGLTWGQFRKPGISNHTDNENDIFFLNRALLTGGNADGTAVGTRDDGVQIGGSFADISFAIHNDDEGDMAMSVGYAMTAAGFDIDFTYATDEDEDLSDNTSMEIGVGNGTFGLNYATTNWDFGVVDVDTPTISAHYDMGNGMAFGVRSQDLEDLAADDIMSIAMHYDLGGARLTIQHDDTGHGDDNTDGGLAIGVLASF